MLNHSLTDPIVSPPKMYFDRHAKTIIIGTTEIAIPRYVAPKSLAYTPLKFAISIGSVNISLSNKRTIGTRKLFHEPTKLNIEIVAIQGVTSGNIILLNVLNSLQPSILAASISVFGIDESIYCLIKNTVPAVAIDGMISGINVFNVPNI